MLLTEYNEAETMALFKEEGIEEGEDRLGILMTKLVDDGRIADITRASGNKDYRHKLYAEYGIV